MAKTNPDLEVQAFARGASGAVLSILVTRPASKGFPSLRHAFGIRTIMADCKDCEFGTGFVIRSNNAGSIVMTARHVVSNIKWAAGDKLYVRCRKRFGVGVRQLPARVLYEHRHADVAFLRVPQLKNALALPFDQGFLNGNANSIIAIGFVDPDGLFTRRAMKCIPDISPGGFMELNGGPIQDEVDISNLHMQLIGVQGMSGCPIVSAAGVVGMLITGDGKGSNAVSNNSICQVMKQYHRMRLHQATPMLTEAELDAAVNPMSIDDLTDVL